MPTRNRLLSNVLFAVGVAVLVGTVLYYLHITQPKKDTLASNLPQMISDIPLSQMITGRAAIGSIQQLHGKDFPLADGVVAVYGNQDVILWVSDAGSIPGAEELTELMHTRISEGRSPFEELGDFELDGLTIYALDGLGQKHFYWQSGQLVVWLAADRNLAEQVLEESADFFR